MATKFLFVTVFVFLFFSAAPLKILRSQLELEDYGKYISGAHLLDNRRVNIKDITLCIRFNFPVLGSTNGRSQLIHIQDFKENPGVSSYIYKGQIFVTILSLGLYFF